MKKELVANQVLKLICNKDKNLRKPTIVGIGELFWNVLPERRFFGGSPGNVVYHAAKQGAEAYLVSAVGDDVDGYELRAELGRKGIFDKYVSTAPALPTGTAVADHDGVMFGCDTRAPVAWDLIQYSPDLERLAEKANAVCFGLLSQRKDVTASTIRYFLEATKPECLRVLDLNLNHNCFSKNIVTDSLRLCNILKLNADELEWLTDLLDLGGNKAVMSILVHRYNLKYIVLTRGTDGSVLYDGDSFVVIPALSYEEEVDDSGCGDAFTAAFVTALLYDLRPADAMLHASKVAGYVCSKGGAMPEIPPEHRLVVHNNENVNQMEPM